MILLITDARIEVTKSKEIHKFKEEHHERLLDKDKDMFYKLYKHKNIVTALNLLTNYPQKQNILDNYRNLDPIRNIPLWIYSI